MSNFKAGDRVRILDDDLDSSPQHVGKIVTLSKVTDLDAFFRYKGRDVPWNLDSIENETPQLRTRRLTMAADTTATECGKCSCLTVIGGDRMHCQADQRDLECSSVAGRAHRLASCIAAEVA